jgi:anti-sigma-K factor RskA
MSDPRDEARDLNAAEHALGVLDAEGRAAAQARLLTDPVYAAEVEVWEGRFDALTEDVAPVEPPVQVWTRIEQVTGGNVTALPPPKPAAPTKAAGAWRVWGAGAVGLAAAGIAAMVFLSPTPQIAEPHHMVAKVMAMDGHPDVVVSYTTGTKDLMLTPVGAMPPKGMTPRMWLMRKDGTVRLVGDVDMARPERKKLNAEMAHEMEGAAGVMISMESSGQKPGLRPTGPMVAKGMFSLV